MFAWVGELAASMGGCVCLCAGLLDRWEMVVEKSTKKEGPM